VRPQKPASRRPPSNLRLHERLASVFDTGPWLTRLFFNFVIGPFHRRRQLTTRREVIASTYVSLREERVRQSRLYREERANEASRRMDVRQRLSWGTRL
jgi:hypothetical protein